MTPQLISCEKDIFSSKGYPIPLSAIPLAAMVTQKNAVPSGGDKNKISKLPLKPKTLSLNPPLVKRTTRAGQKEVSQSKEMVVNPLSTRISLTPDEQEEVEVSGTPENSEDETLHYGDAENELSFDQNPYAHIPPIPSISINNQIQTCSFIHKKD